MSEQFDPTYYEELSAMNRVAELVVNRDDAPGVKDLDTAMQYNAWEIITRKDTVTKEDVVEEGVKVKYALARTGRVGIADPDEFVQALYGTAVTNPTTGLLAIRRLQKTYNNSVGSPVYSYPNAEKSEKLGIVAKDLEYIVRKTPQQFTKGRGYSTYAGSIWGSVLHRPNGTTEAQVIRFPLLSIHRPAHRQEVVPGMVNERVALGIAALGLCARSL